MTVAVGVVACARLDTSRNAIASIHRILQLHPCNRIAAIAGDHQ